MESRKRRLAIFGIALPLMAMNFAAVNLAMTALQQQFNATIPELQWILNSFGICMAVFMVTMGKLADAHGRRLLYLIGTGLLCVASFISGIAPKLIWIILAQGMQGIGGAIVIPISQALLSHLYPVEKRSHAIGIWAMLACLSLGLGPVIGGVILEVLGWRWIFFINVPITLISFFFLLIYVPESKNPHRSEIDAKGILLLILTIGSLIVSIMQASEWGIHTLWTVALFLISLILFIYSEKRSRSPIIPPTFFFKRTFLLSTLANFCIVFFVWGDFFLLPYYLQNQQGLSPLSTGLLMLLITGPVVLFSSLISKWYAKTGPRLLMIGGFCFFALSSLVQLFLSPPSLALPLFAAFCFGLGWVIAWGPSITSAVSSVPHESAGLASGAFTTMQEIGGTLGLTIAGTLFRLHNNFSSGVFALLAVALLGLIFSLCLKSKHSNNSITT
jgi:EmrB/QacA subfamily drug resistance transporter